jgi:RimJ/RimL family protein N-acetyltransferase
MPSSRNTARIGFRDLNAADLSMLAQWLADPRNSAHWGGSGETDALEDHLTDHRVAQWIVTRDGTDVAYIQDYDIHAYEDHPLAALPKGARGIDTFIGQSSWMGTGLGPSYLALHVQRLFDSGVPALGIDPEPENGAAIRAYEKVGFRGSEVVHTKWGTARVMTLWPNSAEAKDEAHLPETASVLVCPKLQHLEAYCFALRNGWSPDNLRSQAADEQLEWIVRDPRGFLDRLEDVEAKGPPVRLPDGSEVPRLPGLRRWIWQDGFCGSIGLRWQSGSNDLPPNCLGHIGYAVVPWRRGEGLATRALIDILPLARSYGLTHVDLTADPDNHASIRVMEKAGAQFVTSFTTPAALGGMTDLLYRIHL